MDNLLKFVNEYALNLDKIELTNLCLYSQQGLSTSNISSVRLPPLTKSTELELKDELKTTIKENLNLEYLKMG